MAVLEINNGSEYNKMKDQSSAGGTNWLRHKAQSSTLTAQGELYSYMYAFCIHVIACNVALSSGSNRAKEDARIETRAKYPMWE